MSESLSCPIAAIHQAGIETVQELLLLGSALEKEHVEQNVGHLSEQRHRDVLLALYRDRLDYRSARSKFGVPAKELNEFHQAALVECLARTDRRMPT